MKALVQLMAFSAGTIAAVAIPSCTSTCEEKGNCGDYEADDSTTGGRAGSNGTGGNPTGGRGGSAGGGMGGTGLAGGGGTDGGGAGGGGGEGGMGPDPCDSENPVAGCAISDPNGIFVAPSGDDAASGDRDYPFQTISKAISEAADSGRTIYVCNGSFAEHLVVSTDGRVIRGGYRCPSAGITGWVYEANTYTRVRPAEPGYALHLQSVEGFVASDIDFAARDATAPGESSVAIFAASSTGVRFERTRIIAGDGVDGDDGMLPGSNHFAGNQGGNNATAAAGGEAKTCDCGDGSTSTGALGGAGGVTPTAGGLGLPDHQMGGGAPGAAGTTLTACTNGGLGAPAPARTDAGGASTIGSIHATNGWLPRSGSNGNNGQPGQGGGGGGGAIGAGKGGGGGGACGGCGGFGGPGGQGGGGSIALLALDSEIVVDASSVIQTSDAGSGGAGASGETGQDGGVRGIADGNGCPGGAGGKGAAGGAGGGGAAGVSVGILSKGGMIVSEGVEFTIGNEGSAGQGGGMDNDGAVGIAAETERLP